MRTTRTTRVTLRFTLRAAGAWLFMFTLIMVFLLALHSAESHAQGVTPHESATDILVTQDVAFVTRDAETVFWQVSDNAPTLLVMPVFPSMTRVDGQGFIKVVTDHAPVYWRQVACYEANETPFDIDASNIVCSAFPGLDAGEWPDFAITMTDVQTLFDNRGYAIGAVK